MQVNEGEKKKKKKNQGRVSISKGHYSCKEKKINPLNKHIFC